MDVIMDTVDAYLLRRSVVNHFVSAASSEYDLTCWHGRMAKAYGGRTKAGRTTFGAPRA